MAVDLFAKTATFVRNDTTYIHQNIQTATMTAEAEAVVAVESKRGTTTTKEAIKRAKLRRERTELVRYLYNIIDTTRPSRRTTDCDSTTSSDSELLEESDEMLDCCDFDLKFHRRKTAISRQSKRERTPAPKEKKFLDFCRVCQTPENITLEKGSKKALRVKFYECTKQISRDDNRRQQNVERKANIEKKLRKLGLKRLEEIVRQRTQNMNEYGRAAQGKFALNKGNVPKEMGDIVDFLLSLQFREVTPEDYDFLLRLDESVPAKTVSNKRLASLREEEVNEKHIHELCGICMENYQVGESRKILPCEHAFHSGCIDTWLGQSSTKCPLDGQEI